MRQLRKEESDVLNALLRMAASSAKPPVEDDLFAVDLADGGMGSIRLTGKSDRARKTGSELVTAHYIDQDQVPVIISINLDQDGKLFEMDFWKVDFSSLKRYPSPGMLQSGQPGAKET